MDNLEGINIFFGGIINGGGGKVRSVIGGGNFVNRSIGYNWFMGFMFWFIVVLGWLYVGVVIGCCCCCKGVFICTGICGCI